MELAIQTFFLLALHLGNIAPSVPNFCSTARNIFTEENGISDSSARSDRPRLAEFRIKRKVQTSDASAPRANGLNPDRKKQIIGAVTFKGSRPVIQTSPPRPRCA